MRESRIVHDLDNFDFREVRKESEKTEYLGVSDIFVSKDTHRRLIFVF